VVKQGSSPDQPNNISRAGFENNPALREEHAREFGFSNDAGWEAGRIRTQRLFTGIASTGTDVPQVYTDKKGLPVTYDAAAPEQPKIKSDEMSILWHELLSPFTVIKGYVSTLLDLDYAITEEQKKQYLRGIESASNRVIRLLENLRDITQLEETDAITPHRVSLLDILRQIVSDTQSQTTKHVIKTIPPGRMPLVTADPEKIQQVMTNLLGNAVKYSPQGGDIEVSINIVRDEEELRRLCGDAPSLKLPCLVTIVADNGIGIPEAEKERIFERFHRVNTKLTRTTPGAGLGLYICKLIIEAHGGKIWARNRLQGGSFFSFTLPLD
jgi:signal transduction histidine kinase